MVPPYYQVHGGGVGKFPLGSLQHYAKSANCSFGITVRTSLRSQDQLQAKGLTIVNGLRKKGRPIMVISRAGGTGPVAPVLAGPIF